MVTTRSNTSYLSLLGDKTASEDTNKKKQRKTKNKNRKKKIKIKLVPCVEKEDDDDNDSLKDFIVSEDEEDNDETIESEEDDDSDNETYTAPKYIKKNKELHNIFQRIVKQIQNKIPKLESILNLKVRQKRKVELMELYYIYKYNSYPYTEERLHLKEIILKKVKKYEREYREFKGNRKIFLQMEKNEVISNDLFNIRRKILSLKTDEQNQKNILQKFSTLENQSINKDEEYFKTLQYLQNVLRLPFQRMKSVVFEKEETASFLLNLKEKLDNTIYGQTQVKEQILLYMHNRIINPTSFSKMNLCFIGPPGIGKTSLAQSLAESLNTPFAQINMGGCNSVESLLGHSFTYVSSRPGKISEALMNMGFSNGVIFFDELEKATDDNVINSLLHITDATTNHKFKDNYFGEITIDLSKIFFIMSMNEKPLEKALNDRLFFIRMSDYNLQDKVQIVKNYLLPKTLNALKLNKKDILFDEKNIKYFIQKIGESSDNNGIRKLKQYLNQILSKIVFLIYNKTIETSFSIDSKIRNLNFPFIIDNDVIDKLGEDLDKVSINSSLMHLYV